MSNEACQEMEHAIMRIGEQPPYYNYVYWINKNLKL